MKYVSKEKRQSDDVVEKVSDGSVMDSLNNKVGDEKQDNQNEIFVSYDHTNDREYFNAIKKTLSDFKVNTFDYAYERRMHYRELESNVKKSKIFISIYSNSKFRSRLSEIDLAIENKIPLLLVRTNVNVIIDEKYSQISTILFEKDDLYEAVNQILGLADKENDAAISVNEIDTVGAKSYMPYFLSEGNHKETTDQLDFENDCSSCTVLLMRHLFHPGVRMPYRNY